MVSVIFDRKKSPLVKIVIVLLALAMALPDIQAQTMATSDMPAEDEAIESAFTDEIFLAAVRELVGKTNGEHIYRADVENMTELVVNGYYNNNKGPYIESLDGIEYFTALEKLDCGGNALYTLDLSHNPNLKEVQCWFNYLTTLDPSHNPKLEVLDCSYNELESLDVSNCPELRLLDCNYTVLQELDVSHNTKLVTLICNETELRTLDISNNVWLEKLDIWGGHLVNLDVSNNPRLEYLDCCYHDMCAVDSIKGLENCPALKDGTFVFEPQNNPTGGHTPGTAWETDGVSHWHTCAVCGAEQDRADHVYDDDQDAVCDTCGYKRAVTPPAPPTPSGGGGGSSSPVRYSVTVEKDLAGGSVTSSVQRAERGDKVTLTVRAQEGYTLEEVEVKDGKGKEVTLTRESGGKYTFTMPGSKVTVTARFAKKPKEEKPPEVKPGELEKPTLPFSDVKEGAWYYDAVAEVYGKGLMMGLKETEFSPETPASRGMVAYALYRQEGEPAAGNSSYSDVPDGKDYTQAVAWAMANGIVKGYGDGTFRPDRAVTREELAAILYRYGEYKGKDMVARADLSGFTDAGQISGYAREPLAWAKAKGFINGTDWGGIHPGGYATRAEAAAILMRCGNGR